MKRLGLISKIYFHMDSNNFSLMSGIPNNVLIDLYELGNTNINSDSIADIFTSNCINWP